MSAVPPDDESRASTSESRLQRIDDVLVPRLQRLARPFGRALGWPGRALRGLDDQLAGGRPARAVRAHRGLATFLIVALAFGAAAVHAQRYPVLQERARQVAGDQDPALDPDARPGDVDTDTDGAPRAVGPLTSARVEPYLAARAEALASAPDAASRAAVVSFDAFLAPAEAAEVLDGFTVHRVQYRLPERTPRPTEVEVGEPGLVPRLERELTQVLEQLRTEEEEVASTLESGVEDDSFRADYEARLDELTALHNILASDPAVVFAAVVEGPVQDLRGLADRDRVRLVDLAAQGVRVEGTSFFGLLPTDRDRITYGRSV